MCACGCALCLLCFFFPEYLSCSGVDCHEDLSVFFFVSGFFFVFFVLPNSVFMMRVYAVSGVFV